MNTTAIVAGDAYLEAREAVVGSVLREESSRARVPELELQARIYAGEFGLRWRGEDGEAVEIVHFGTWNREPGPDFCGAKILVNGEEHCGDIEIDGEARDWESHGHASNENYNNVVLHVFFRRSARRLFTRTLENKAVSQVCLSYPAVEKSTRINHQAEPLDEEQAARLIEEAAKFRLRRKSEAFQRAVALRGRGEAYFQAIATGLGYKNNKVPFLLVAQRAGLERARAKDGEALLFGLAGFLQASHFDQGDDESRDYLRSLWEAWWAMSARESRLILQPEQWKFAALRPANHPHRRMGALAAVCHSFPKILKAADSTNVESFRDALTSVDHLFWRNYSSLSRDTLLRPTSLIGSDRALDLVINVLLPSLPEAVAWERMRSIAGPTPNQKVLKAAEWIYGSSNLRFCRSAAQQQGLLQLVADFSQFSPAGVWKVFSGNHA